MKKKIIVGTISSLLGLQVFFVLFLFLKAYMPWPVALCGSYIVLFLLGSTLMNLYKRVKKKKAVK